jgi:hypothetical protein
MSKGTRNPAADSSNTKTREAAAKQALNRMTEALRLLDTNDGPHDVRAHLDLAINRLQESIDKGEDTAG